MLDSSLPQCKMDHLHCAFHRAVGYGLTAALLAYGSSHFLSDLALLRQLDDSSPGMAFEFQFGGGAVLVAVIAGVFRETELVASKTRWIGGSVLGSVFGMLLSARLLSWCYPSLQTSRIRIFPFGDLSLETAVGLSLPATIFAGWLVGAYTNHHWGRGRATSRSFSSDLD